MKLSNPFSKHKQEPPMEDSYLALTLTPDKIMACVWNFNLEDINIQAVEERPFKDSENLIHETAVAIDSACQKADTDVSKVVFGLSQSWFEGEDISEKSAKVLKALSEDLELEAQAFVSLASSINHFFKVTEGITPQAVLVGIFQSQASTFCEVHKVFNSKVTSTKTSTQILSVEKISTLIGQLKEGDETLPARIIIYGNPDSELLEKLQSSKFEGLFVHQSKIDFVENDKLAASVAYAQAADVLGHDPLPQNGQKTGPAETGESKQEETQTKHQQSQGADELGFVAGVDILQNQKPEAEEEQIPAPSPIPRHRGPIRKEDYAVEIEESDYQDQPAAVRVPKLPKFRIPRFFKMPSLPKPSKKLGIILATVLALVAIGIFAAGQSLTSAEVNIKVTAKSQDGTFKATVVPQGSYDKSQSQIPGLVITGKSSGSQKATATGNKMIGTKAKGNINVFNFDDTSAKTFPAQTEIITKDGLKFTVDNDVQVPARVGGIGGQASVSATAEDVGSKYNIAQKTSFNIVGFDNVLYYAESINDFTGGDSKQATVVSQDDFDKMAKSLTESLTQKAKDDFKTKSQGANIPDGSLVISVLKKDFDKKVDEEASIINLDMEIEVSTVSFDQNDLQKLISEMRENQANLESRPGDIEVFDTSVKRTKDTLAISGSFRAKLIPKFNEDQLAVQIAGKNIKEARSIIKQIPEVSDVLVSFSPAIPFVDSIPRAKSKIKFKIEIS